MFVEKSILLNYYCVIACKLTVITAALVIVVVVVVVGAVLAAVAHVALLVFGPKPHLEVGHGIVGVAAHVARLGRDDPTCDAIWKWDT